MSPFPSLALPLPILPLPVSSFPQAILAAVIPSCPTVIYIHLIHIHTNHHYYHNPRRGMIDMRRRFRGNQPIAYSRTVNEATGEVHEKREPVPQMYAGKPPVMVESETVKDGGSGFDPEKTRGF